MKVTPKKIKLSKPFAIVAEMKQFLAEAKLSPRTEKRLRRLVSGTFRQGNRAGYKAGFWAGHEAGWDAGMENCGFELNRETGEYEHNPELEYQ